jgi:hypothetical protein
MVKCDKLQKLLCSAQSEHHANMQTKHQAWEHIFIIINPHLHNIDRTCVLFVSEMWRIPQFLDNRLIADG